MQLENLEVAKTQVTQIGIVVIGRNEGERLLLSLGAAKSQCQHVVYADSASTDGSVEAALGMGVTVVCLSADGLLTAARGRRAGFEQLVQDAPECRFVQFIDADCILEEEWLATASSFLDSRKEAGVVCGRRYEAFPMASLYHRLIDAEWDTPIGLAKACGGDALMRVEAVRSAGSFRADLVAGEEPELCTRLRAAGWEIWRIDAPMTEHDAKISRLREWWKRSERGGLGYAQARAATQRTGQPLYGRQIASALFWTVILPLLVAAAASLEQDWRVLLLLPALYMLQGCRIFVRRGGGTDFAFRVSAAAVMMLMKIAEAKGIFSYLVGQKKLEARAHRNGEVRVLRPTARA
ncbi:glycosyltransferase [Sphingomonas piscis]